MEGRVKRLSFVEVEGLIPLPVTLARIEVEVTDLQEAAQTLAPGTRVEINVAPATNPKEG